MWSPIFYTSSNYSDAFLPAAAGLHVVVFGIFFSKRNQKRPWGCPRDLKFGGLVQEKTNDEVGFDLRDRSEAKTALKNLLSHIQSWPKKFVLGCVIPPAGAVARSRNLGQTFSANSSFLHLEFLAFSYTAWTCCSKVGAIFSNVIIDWGNEKMTKHKQTAVY